MSTVISYIKLDTSEKLSDIMLSVMAKETLGQFVRRIKHTKNLTLSQIEKNSKGEISKGYVHDLIKGKAENPSYGKMQALATGLQVDIAEIEAIVSGEKYERSEDFLKSRLGVASLRIQSLGKKSQEKAEVLVESLETLLDKLEAQEQK
jgi:transcriptional regulator with XRE-family HTH domain